MMAISYATVRAVTARRTSTPIPSTMSHAAETTLAKRQTPALMVVALGTTSLTGAQ